MTPAARAQPPHSRADEPGDMDAYRTATPDSRASGRHKVAAATALTSLAALAVTGWLTLGLSPGATAASTGTTSTDDGTTSTDDGSTSTDDGSTSTTDDGSTSSDSTGSSGVSG